MSSAVHFMYNSIPLFINVGQRGIKRRETDCDSEAARLKLGDQLVARPVGPLPALSDRQLVEMHMHDDIRRVVDFDRLYSNKETQQNDVAYCKV